MGYALLCLAGQPRLSGEAVSFSGQVGCLDRSNFVNWAGFFSGGGNIRFSNPCLGMVSTTILSPILPHTDGGRTQTQPVLYTEKHREAEILIKHVEPNLNYGLRTMDC